MLKLVIGVAAAVSALPAAPASADTPLVGIVSISATEANNARYIAGAEAAAKVQPKLAVDESGQVAISAFALANGRVDEVLLLSRPRELRFRPPLRVTTAPFDPLDPTTASRGKEGAWWIGDWQGIASSAGAFHLVWNDTRTGKLDLFAATVRA